MWVGKILTEIQIKFKIKEKKILNKHKYMCPCTRSQIALWKKSALGLVSKEGRLLSHSDMTALQ